MGVEIERKFLVTGEAWRSEATKCVRIRQGYLRADDEASIRVRVRDDGRAALTIKTSRAQLQRQEFEYEIPSAEAEMLLTLRLGALVEKVRHIVPYAGLIWEVDVFENENAGLCIAEVELGAVDQRVERPRWVGREVTMLAQYYNSALAQHPFSVWSDEDRAGAAG